MPAKGTHRVRPSGMCTSRLCQLDQPSITCHVSPLSRKGIMQIAGASIACSDFLKRYHLVGINYNPACCLSNSGESTMACLVECLCSLVSPRAICWLAGWSLTCQRSFGGKEHLNPYRNFKSLRPPSLCQAFAETRPVYTWKLGCEHGSSQVYRQMKRSHKTCFPKKTAWTPSSITACYTDQSFRELDMSTFMLNGYWFFSRYK